MAKNDDQEQGDVSESAPQQGAEQPQDGNKGSAGVFGTLFPPDARVWGEARKLVADKSIRVEDLAVCASQDPVIVIELLRTSNAMFFAGGRSPITSVKTAIVRLGSDVVLDTLEKMRERPPFDNERVQHWFETHRSRCRRTAIVARLLGEAVARNLADDCQTAGLFVFLGEMLAVAHFGTLYANLADKSSRTAVNFRLLQDHKFDVEKMGLNYLRRAGIPEVLLFAIDRDARSRSPERAVLRPLCTSAGELVDAFDNNRWERFAPGKVIPSKSAIRMLQMNDSQYLKVYERASEYLFSAKLTEERTKQQAVWTAQSIAAAADTPPEPSADGQSSERESLESEIENIIQERASGEMEAVPPPPPPVSSAPTAIAPPQRQETQIQEVATDLKDNDSAFALKKTPERRVPRLEKKDSPTPPPRLRTSKGTEVVSNIASMFDQAETSEDLLSKLLQMLIDNGPFQKSALIVVSKDRKHAIVVAARGENISHGQKIALDDPLSPLAHCFSKLQSFGSKKNSSSPFGSRSFALAPIDADHATPVALYADCGERGALTFEARRIFRTVVDILNQRLPTIPGGIPVELES